MALRRLGCRFDSCREHHLKNPKAFPSRGKGLITKKHGRYFLSGKTQRRHATDKIKKHRTGETFFFTHKTVLAGIPIPKTSKRDTGHSGRLFPFEKTGRIRGWGFLARKIARGKNGKTSALLASQDSLQRSPRRTTILGTPRKRRSFSPIFRKRLEKGSRKMHA